MKPSVIKCVSVVLCLGLGMGEPAAAVENSPLERIAQQMSLASEKKESLSQ